MADNLSTALTTELNAHSAALPQGFNIDRFVQNSIALLNGNDSLITFAKKYGTDQIKAGLLRGAYLGLDALNQEMYLIPYGSTLNFIQSYKGDRKMVMKYCKRPVKDIYAQIVREGDEYSEGIVDGRPTINFKPVPFSDKPVVGAFAVCLYEDGGMMYDSMSLKDLETTRGASKAKNSPAWAKFTTEMYKKTILHRLCKHLAIDMDAFAKSAFDSGVEIETDPSEIAKREIKENANTEELVVDSEAVEA